MTNIALKYFPNDGVNENVKNINFDNIKPTDKILLLSFPRQYSKTSILAYAIQGVLNEYKVNVDNIIVLNVCKNKTLENYIKEIGINNYYSVSDLLFKGDNYKNCVMFIDEFFKIPSKDIEDLDHYVTYNLKANKALSMIVGSPDNFIEDKKQHINFINKHCNINYFDNNKVKQLANDNGVFLI